ncbi:MAG: type VII secretion protein EssC [Clostridiales bacterium]|nr:type VII secretion protein EssC [Clostridiales bacterium]
MQKIKKRQGQYTGDMFILRVIEKNEIRDCDISNMAKLNVGRSENCNVVLRDNEILPVHLTITTSFNSTTPTMTIKPHDSVAVSETQLKPGDVFMLKANAIALQFISINTNDVKRIMLPARRVCVGRADGSDIAFAHNNISREQFCLQPRNGTYFLEDYKSTNGTYVNGHRVREKELKNKDRIVTDRYLFVYENATLLAYGLGHDASINLAWETVSIKKDLPEYPYLKRSPRLRKSLPEGEIEIQSPPMIGGKPSINWLSVLIGPLSMAAITIVIALLASPQSMIYTLPMTLVSIFVAIVTYRGQLKKFRESTKIRSQRYDAYLKEVVEEIEKKEKQQLSARLDVHPDSKECAVIVKSRTRRLWERQPSDDDFMSLRLGLGTERFLVSIKAPKKVVSLEDDELETKAQAIAEKHAHIESVPVAIDFKKVPSYGFIGDRKESVPLIKAMLLQAVTHHSYREVNLVVLFPDAESERWESLRWLPHIHNQATGIRYIAGNARSCADLLKQMEEALGQRERLIRAEEYRSNEKALAPFLLFMIADISAIADHTICRLLTRNDPRMGIGIVLIADTIEQLPKDCIGIVECQGKATQHYDRRQADQKEKFTPDRFDDTAFDRAARSLAPIRLQEGADSGGLPEAITFLQGFNAKQPCELPLEASWASAAANRSMAVPIGVKENGDPFLFDIHEKKHGPHGLIAGMTGSGKSEMVQSWILSMAVRFPPQAVSFVLIDFKGTGLILPFLNLPHLAGTISDLDTNIHRNLIALENELSRRKALFDHYGVNNISGYLQLRQKQNELEPLSYLFVVIDEFAEFKVQFPDFMTVVDRIFATGRTLGVHVLLLTQKPTGVVNDKMNANTRFRWCLKVASSADSRDMLGHTDAAAITQPGRAYVQVGEDEVYAQIQSFWSGAPYLPNRAERVTVNPRISAVSLRGERMRYAQNDKTMKHHSGDAEIDVIVRHIRDYTLQRKIASANKVWTQKLPDALFLEDLSVEPVAGSLRAVVGQVDDPRAQNQYPLSVDFTAEGHFVVFGAPQSGKTTFLHTLILSLARNYTPEEINLYLMDFGNWSMGQFAGLPHVGGVANDNDEEKVEKLAKMLGKELRKRRSDFSDCGAGNIAAYREISGKTLPYIVLILDNFTPVLNLYPALEDFFITITRESANYGIYLATCANTPMSLGYRINQNIKSGIALQMSDYNDFAQIVGKTGGLTPENIPGRGLVRSQQGPLEFQTALPAKSFKDSERTRLLRQIVQEMKDNWHGAKARPIPILPQIIPFGSVQTSGCAIGLTAEEVEPITLDMALSHYAVISGTPGSGKSNFLKVIARSLFQEEERRLIAFDSLRQGLAELQGELGNDYALYGKQMDDLLESAARELNARKEIFTSARHTTFAPIIILVDDIKDCFDGVCEKSIDRLCAIMRLGKGLGVYLIAAGQADDITRLNSQGERFTAGLISGAQAILLGGSYRAHSCFAPDVPYSQQEIPFGEYEGSYLKNRKPMRFKAMFSQ